MKCEHCGGSLYDDWGEMICLNCGRVLAKLRFECNRCPVGFPDFAGLVEHFEMVHRSFKETAGWSIAYGITATEDFIRQAQLESDQKEYDELKEELEYLYESYEIAIEVLDAEHKAVIVQLFKQLEEHKGCWDTFPRYYKISEYNLQAIKHKYGGK